MITLKFSDDNKKLYTYFFFNLEKRRIELANQVCVMQNKFHSKILLNNASR